MVDAASPLQQGSQQLKKKEEEEEEERTEGYRFPRFSFFLFFSSRCLAVHCYFNPSNIPSIHLLRLAIPFSSLAFETTSETRLSLSQYQETSTVPSGGYIPTINHQLMTTTVLIPISFSLFFSYLHHQGRMIMNELTVERK